MTFAIFGRQMRHIFDITMTCHQSFFSLMFFLLIVFRFFASVRSPAPILKIPVRCYSITEFFLEDICSRLRLDSSTQQEVCLFFFFHCVFLRWSVDWVIFGGFFLNFSKNV